MVVVEVHMNIDLFLLQLVYVQKLFVVDVEINLHFRRFKYEEYR